MKMIIFCITLYDCSRQTEQGNRKMKKKNIELDGKKERKTPGGDEHFLSRAQTNTFVCNENFIYIKLHFIYIFSFHTQLYLSIYYYYYHGTLLIYVFFSYISFECWCRYQQVRCEIYIAIQNSNRHQALHDSKYCLFGSFHPQLHSMSFTRLLFYFFSLSTCLFLLEL
jgi:hypothetical protein